jgi:ABC-2 type transport system ATP-binding protein
MLEIDHVSKIYNRGNKHHINAVDDVTLSLARGVIGLIGHNGAGKTTLMQMIATLTKPTLGVIRFNGVDIAASPDVMRKRLGYLPQDFGVYPHLTAREFLQYFAALKGVGNSGPDKNRIAELLDMVNLREHADLMAATFSGGMRQRLGIAVALLNRPDILIVDEPTAGLDPEERLRFRHVLAEIGFEKLVIVSTHIVSDIESMADKIAVMRNGKLIAMETPDAILDNARGHIWQVTLNTDLYPQFAATHHVLHAQRLANKTNKPNQTTVRFVSSTEPQFVGVASAEVVTPSLEEALMTSRYMSHQDVSASNKKAA